MSILDFVILNCKYLFPILNYLNIYKLFYSSIQVFLAKIICGNVSDTNHTHTVNGEIIELYRETVKLLQKDIFFLLLGLLLLNYNRRLKLSIKQD